MRDNKKPIPPSYTKEDVKRLLSDLYSLDHILIKPLDGYIDLNFYIKDQHQGQEFVFKISNTFQKEEILAIQHQAMNLVSTLHSSIKCQAISPTLKGKEITKITHPTGASHLVRLLTYLPGTFFSNLEAHSQALFENLGQVLGEMDRIMENFYHPSLHYYFNWDLQNFLDLEVNIPLLQPLAVRRLVKYFMRQYNTVVSPILPKLRRSVIHNDANGYNILVQAKGKDWLITGFIDFGDMIYTHTIFELAIAIAYAIPGQPDPLETACRITAGYHQKYPLNELELEVLFPLISARLCTTLLISASQLQLDPKNEYLTISVEPAREALETLIKIDPLKALKAFRDACGFPVYLHSIGLSPEQLSQARKNLLGKNLSTSYKSPLKIVRGAFQYLYDHKGQRYLDTVNNVCHVGHCHPDVVEAGQKQMAILNTNTRYLHDNIIEYAQQLSATLPEPLQVCYFVNSGSEANELALRLARAYTGKKDFIVIDQAYHGNTNAVIEISPYKFDGPGGIGAPPHVHKAPIPGTYRGPYKTSDSQAGLKYAQEVLKLIEELQKNNKKPAAFIHESIMSVAGQIVFPQNYLSEVYKYVRDAGGICIADEVQVGFARIGSHMWAFEAQGVVPDIVTMGKPMGNGHPLGAVFTTKEIADSFDNGMEYFNTYGGNPVSCAIGLSVLKVIRDEGLQENALKVGKFMKNGLNFLLKKHSLIGDVRGMGLFLGIELVQSRKTLEPAKNHAYEIAEKMKDNGILISIDGPLHNVIKIKPPIVFSESDASFYIETLNRILSNL